MVRFLFSHTFDYSCSIHNLFHQFITSFFLNKSKVLYNSFFESGKCCQIFSPEDVSLKTA